jgi:heat shock protein HslJ
MKFLILFSALLAVAFSDCSQNVNLNKNNSVIPGTWKVAAIDTSGGSLLILSGDDLINISFLENEEVEGFASGLCGNNFLGNYRLESDSTIAIKNLISSEAACPPQSQYWLFFNILQDVSKYKQNDTLLLYNAEMNKILYLVK